MAVPYKVISIETRLPGRGFAGQGKRTGAAQSRKAYRVFSIILSHFLSYRIREVVDNERVSGVYERFLREIVSLLSGG